LNEAVLWGFKTGTVFYKAANWQVGLTITEVGLKPVIAVLDYLQFGQGIGYFLPIGFPLKNSAPESDGKQIAEQLW
jgi:hypothetical protein